MSYRRKRGDKKKLKRFYPWYVLSVPSEWNKLKYSKRYYLSGVRKFAKRYTNKRLRRKNFEYIGSNPSYYRKTYDYWWTLF